MPSFEYRATDSNAQSTTGRVDAASANDAVLLLGQRGLRVQAIQQSIVAPPKATTAPPVTPQAQLNMPNVIVAPTRPRPAPAPAVATSAIKTPMWGHKQQYFHLIQVGDLLRAGVNPADFYKTLASQQIDGSGEAMMEMSRLIAGGMEISTAMAQFPRMFSRNVIGMMRAGEAAGFLPDAATKAGEMEFAAHKWNRFFTWVWLIVVNAVAGIPVALMLAKGLTGAFWQSWETGKDRSPIAEMGHLFKTQTFWQISLTFGFLLAFLWFWKKPMCRRARHWMGLMYPYIRKRAINESLMIFGWTLTRLTASGIYPQRAYALASESIPNDIIAEEFHRIGGGMNENTPVSAPFAHNKYMPVEYRHIASTGEMTGNVPSAIDQIYKLAETEFDYHATKAKFVMGTAGLLWFTITGLIIMAVIIKFYYSDLIAKFLNEQI